jgi:hypothetical protein
MPDRYEGPQTRISDFPFRPVSQLRVESKKVLWLAGVDFQTGAVEVGTDLESLSEVLRPRKLWSLLSNCS